MKRTECSSFRPFRSYRGFTIPGMKPGKKYRIGALIRTRNFKASRSGLIVTNFGWLQAVGIKLYDHVIIAGDDYVSYRRSGAMDLFRYQY